MRRSLITAVAGVFVAGGALVAAPAASAGENRVVVDGTKAGSSTSCIVQSVRPIQARELPRGGPRVGLPFVNTATVMHVGVLC